MVCKCKGLLGTARNMHIRQTLDSELPLSMSVLVNGVFVWGYKNSSKQEMFCPFKNSKRVFYPHTCILPLISPGKEICMITFFSNSHTHTQVSDTVIPLQASWQNWTAQVEWFTCLTGGCGFECSHFLLWDDTISQKSHKTAAVQPASRHSSCLRQDLRAAHDTL